MKPRGARADAPGSFRWRAYLLLGLLGACALALIYRAVNLQLVDHGFLAKEGDARFSRVLEIVAHRGTITDRYGEPLADNAEDDFVVSEAQHPAVLMRQLHHTLRAVIEQQVVLLA